MSIISDDFHNWLKRDNEPFITNHWFNISLVAEFCFVVGPEFLVVVVGVVELNMSKSLTRDKRFRDHKNRYLGY